MKECGDLLPPEELVDLFLPHNADSMISSASFMVPQDAADNSSNKTFACGYCSRKFRRQEHLKRHVRSMHGPEKPYKCLHCDKKFSRLENCEQHQRTHGFHPMGLFYPPLLGSGIFPSASDSDTFNHPLSIPVNLDSRILLNDPFSPSDSQFSQTCGGMTPTGSSDGAKTPPVLSFSETPIFRKQAMPEFEVGSQLGGDKYRYSMIRSDQIRLLMVHKGSFEVPINCSMKAVTMKEIEELKINYYALSYAWGEKHSSLFQLLDINIHDITAEDSMQSLNPDVPQVLANLPSQSMSLWPNLFDALKRLRSTGEDLWFWIDAVCIYVFRRQDSCHRFWRRLPPETVVFSQHFFQDRRIFSPFTSTYKILVSNIFIAVYKRRVLPFSLHNLNTLFLITPLSFLHFFFLS
jgi:hypothetical protein